MKKNYLLLIFLQILFCNFLFAQTWNGNTSTDWNTASNWTPANVPTATGIVTIPGGLSRYPVLASNVTIKGIDMQVGSKLDFKGSTLDIVSDFDYNYFKGATLNNSDGNSNIIINLNTGSAGGTFTQIRSSTVNDNITFNLSGTNSFNEADAGGSANTYEGNVTFNMSAALTTNISHGSASDFKGNLTIKRTTVSGITYVFNGGGNVKGNFSFTNNIDGAIYLGNTSNATTINGKVDISVLHNSPGYFQMSGILNQTSGGNIKIQNTLGFNVQNNIFKVNSMSITGFRGTNHGYLFNNDITGNLDIVDDVSSYDVYTTLIRSNTITGKANFTSVGGIKFYDADIAGSGNHFKGEVNFIGAGTASLYISHGDASLYDGNLIITRPGAGFTQAFNNGGVVKGNFSFTNSTAGGVLFGNTSKVTNVAGKIDIAINNTTTSNFELFRIVNQTSGGIINVKNTKGFNVTQDTLKVDSFNITGFRGVTDAYFFNNDITGNLNITDDVSSYANYKTLFRSNKITGKANFTSVGSIRFYDADIAGSANHFKGEVNFIGEGTASLYISHEDASLYDGNLIITRPGAGFTQAFNNGGVVKGNFSFTNNTAGGVLFGNTSKVTNVAGKIDIAINNTTTSNFELFRMVNQTTGGIINVNNTKGFNVTQDTLKVDSFNITGFRGVTNAYFFNNDITGNLNITDDVSSYANYIIYLRSNTIRGNANFNSIGNIRFYDADAANSGNHYIGNVAYNKNGSGNITVGTGDTTNIGGGLSLNSTAIVLNNIQFTDNIDGIVQQTGNEPVTISTMIMNKGGTAKISLQNPVRATTNLNLISGIIESGVNSNFIVPDNMSYTGGSDSSYVDGPMLKIGNDAFIFPVGQNNKYAPISITAPAAVTDQFRAQYFNEIPHDAGYDTTKKDAALEHISGSEYWLLDRIEGTSDVPVTLSWADNRSGGVNNMADLRVARWNGSKWINHGKGTTTGTNKNGTIQTAEAVSSFSPFTLASVTALNPLPINISRFDAIKNTQSVSLKWSTENEINFSHFEIERADIDNHFSSIGEVTAHNKPSAQHYSFEDMQPLKGVNLYRLKLLDRDGKIMYSKVISVVLNEKGLITIYPNPATDYILIDGVQEGISIEINDASGKLVKRMLSNASNRYSVKDLRKGIYFIKILDKENTKISKLIIR